MKKILATLSCMAALLSAGCATLPSQFSNETPPLSATDTNIVIACATVRQDMPETQIAIETATPLALSASCKQTTTLVRVGGFVYDVGAGLTAVTGTGSISPTIVTDAANGLNTSAPDAALLQGILNSAQGVFTDLNARLQAYANSATNPDVKAYVLATIPIVVNGVGVALMDSTEQYAPAGTTPAATAALMHYRMVRHNAQLVLWTAQHQPENLRQVLAYVR